MQLIQLSELFANSNWDRFFAIYNTIFQEMPFFGIRIYSFIIAQKLEITQLIFPLKNLFGIGLNIYEFRYPKDKRQQEEHGRTNSNNDNKSNIWSSLVSISLVSCHILLLSWRVAVITKDNGYFALGISLFIITYLLYKRHRASKHKLWHQPLFVYIVIAKTCYWLIILFQIGQDKFLLETSGPWEASATLENTTSDTYSSDSGEIQANDNNGSRSLAVEVMICGNTTSIVLEDQTSYILLQVILPLIIAVRLLLPRSTTQQEFSSKMQHVLSLAFDVSEFSHLIVQVPQLHKDLTLVVLIMLFSSASTFLLLQMDFGLGEEGNSGVVKRTSADKSSVFPDSFERLWYYLTIFLLDMPFLVIRLTVMVSFPESIVTFQLVYLLKNVISMVYGIVQIVHKSKTESTDTCTNPNGSWPRSPYCESDM
jgi:hypothetical protein